MLVCYSRLHNWCVHLRDLYQNYATTALFLSWDEGCVELQTLRQQG